MRPKTETIISALRILVNEIQSDDRGANACIAEAADRLEELNHSVRVPDELQDYQFNAIYEFLAENETCGFDGLYSAVYQVAVKAANEAQNGN